MVSPTRTRHSSSSLYRCPSRSVPVYKIWTRTRSGCSQSEFPKEFNLNKDYYIFKIFKTTSSTTFWCSVIKRSYVAFNVSNRVDNCADVAGNSFCLALLSQYEHWMRAFTVIAAQRVTLLQWNVMVGRRTAVLCTSGCGRVSSFCAMLTYTTSTANVLEILLCSLANAINYSVHG